MNPYEETSIDNLGDLVNAIRDRRETPVPKTPPDTTDLPTGPTSLTYTEIGESGVETFTENAWCANPVLRETFLDGGER